MTGRKEINTYIYTIIYEFKFLHSETKMDLEGVHYGIWKTI